MTGGIELDFRTISDFRKDNIDSLKQIFHEFNKRLSESVEWGFTSVDGSKFLANNSKDANFTKNKLDDRIRWLNAHTDEYLRILKDMDEQEDLEEEPEQMTREMIEEKLKEAQERLERYEGYQKLMEESGVTQLSLTDADAKLMKNQNGFAVAYNPQTAVDSETHLIRDFEMTDQVTDHGLISPTMEGIREETPGEILEVVADKGYEKDEDMIACLENGIIPHVITNDGKDGYELEISYEEAEADTTSTDSEEINKSLHSGKIPDVYKDVITDIEVKEVSRKIATEDSANTPKSIYGTIKEMMARAKEGYFVRDPERDLVYCPNGEILRQKYIKRNGVIRYSNKNACKYCLYRKQCYRGKSEWKEVDFSKNCLEKPCKGLLKESSREPREKKSEGQREKVKVVKMFLRPDRTKMAKRLSISESRSER